MSLSTEESSDRINRRYMPQCDYCQRANAVEHAHRSSKQLLVTPTSQAFFHWQWLSQGLGALLSLRGALLCVASRLIETLLPLPHTQQHCANKACPNYPRSLNQRFDNVSAALHRGIVKRGCPMFVPAHLAKAHLHMQTQECSWQKCWHHA